MKLTQNRIDKFVLDLYCLTIALATSTFFIFNAPRIRGIVFGMACGLYISGLTLSYLK